MALAVNQHLVGALGRCELRKPRQSRMFVEPSLCSHDRQRGQRARRRRKPAGAYGRVRGPVPFGGVRRAGTDYGGGPLIGGPGELGVELQRRGTLRVSEAPGDGVQVGARGQELGRGALSAWELDCHASSDQHVAGQSQACGGIGASQRREGAGSYVPVGARSLCAASGFRSHYDRVSNWWAAFELPRTCYLDQPNSASASLKSGRSTVRSCP